MGNSTPSLQIDHSQEGQDALLKKKEEAKKNQTGPYDPINIALDNYTMSLDPNNPSDHDHYIDNITNLDVGLEWQKELNCQAEFCK